MREDMFKVIVERPRRGGRSRPWVRSRLSGDDDLPSKIGVRRHVALAGLRSKYLNENLQPLRRYLGRQVGRPWDKVYSEIAATLAPGHAVKEHVRQHLGDFVAVRVTLGRNGQWIVGASRRWRSRTAPWHQPYYVDPVDGLLKESDKLWRKLKLEPTLRRREDAKSDPDVRRLDASRELRCIDGVWYAIAYDRRPDAPEQEQVFDMLSREHVSARVRHAVLKRQLSGAALKEHGLANALDTEAEAASACRPGGQDVGKARRSGSGRD